MVDTEGVERESLIVKSTGIGEAEDEEEEEEEEELDTTLISNPITIGDTATAISNNSSVIIKDTVTSASTNNIISNHV